MVDTEEEQSERGVRPALRAELAGRAKGAPDETRDIWGLAPPQPPPMNCVTWENDLISLFLSIK